MPNKNGTTRKKLIEELKSATEELARELERVKVPANVFVYNPLTYARDAYFQYLEQYASSPIEALFLGMNPGPFGMMQTGIPFGDIPSVKDFLGISSGVEKPRVEHVRRPIEGFACARREVSGTRLWGLFRDTFKSADDFFQKFFVQNYCPLGFLSATGANVTPDKLPPALRKQIEDLCNEHLRKVVPLMNPAKLIGIGAYASKIFAKLFPEREIHTLLHPSPASPAANRGWSEVASRQLREAGLVDFAR